MHITLFGGIWTLILLGCLVEGKDKNIFFLLFLSMIFQCNNIFSVGDTAIGTQVYSAGVILAYVTLLRRAHGLPTKFRIRMWKIESLNCKMTSLFLTLILSLFVNHCVADKALGVAMLTVYILMAFAISKGRLRIGENELEKAEDYIFILIFVIGILQVAAKSGVTLLKPLLTLLVYNDTANTDVIFNYKATNAFYSTFMEPSYCGAFLIGYFALFMLREKAETKNIILGVLCLIAIVLTRSSTAYGGLMIVVAILFFMRANKKVFKYLLPCMILGGTAYFFFNFNVLNAVLFEKTNTSSYRVRNNWNIAAIEYFKLNPICGVGYKNLRASSLILSILGEMGILGIVAYSVFILSFVREFWKKRGPLIIRHAMFVVGIVICQCIACPDLNFSPFWLAVFFYAAADYCHRKRLGDERKKDVI